MPDALVFAQGKEPVLREYGRYIPNLTRQDGSAFEKQYVEMAQKKWDTIGHNFGHNCDKSSPKSCLLNDFID